MATDPLSSEYKRPDSDSMESDRPISSKRKHSDISSTWREAICRLKPVMLRWLKPNPSDAFKDVPLLVSAMFVSPAMNRSDGRCTLYVNAIIVEKNCKNKQYNLTSHNKHVYNDRRTTKKEGDCAILYRY